MTSTGLYDIIIGKETYKMNAEMRTCELKDGTWKVLLTDDTRHIARSFGPYEFSEAQKILDSLRMGLDVILPLWKSGKHYEEHKTI